MTRTRTRAFGFFAVAVLLACRPVSWSQQAAAPAPIPDQIVAARKVFISNGGVDFASAVDLRRAIGPNAPYNQFYAAMKRWGRYEHVGTPADAELVLQLAFTAPLSSFHTYQPQLTLAILDTKTHFRLWTLTRGTQNM